MRITSPAFSEGGAMPTEYTCDGEDVSPELAFEGVPQGAVTLALICDDPDAPVGVWDHWLIYNIPASAKGLAKAMESEDILDHDTMQGLNSWGRPGYGGPCPPSGTHRYYFKLYALDARLQVKAGLRKAELLRAMDGHILAEARLMGRYSR